MPDPENFTMIDLFCAPGGLSQGFEMAGFTALAGVDIDEKGIETYNRNFPKARSLRRNIENLESLHLMKAADVSPGQVDIIIGGPPCQGFSTIGRVKIASLVREGIWNLKKAHPRFIDDPRNALYREFVRIVRDLKPKFFVMENVPGMKSYRNGEIVKEIKEDFQSIGYQTDAEILNAVEYEVPQRRKRIFFIGNRLKIPNPFPSPKNEPQVTVWDAIGDLPEIEAGRGREVMNYTKKEFSDYQKWARKDSPRVYNHVARFHNERDLKVFAVMEEGSWWKDLPQDLKSLYGYRDDIFHDKLKRLKRNEPSWTVVAHLYKDGYMYIHPTQTRTITVREAARLQSFPDHFRFMGARTHQFKQVGNAVPPLLAKAVAKEVHEALQKVER